MQFGFGLPVTRPVRPRYMPVVSTNLTLFLDPSNTASYPGTGNTYTDLSGLGHNFTKTAGTYKNGNFEDPIFLYANNYLAKDVTIQSWIKTTELGNGDFHYELMQIMAAETAGPVINPTDFGFGVRSDGRLGFGTGDSDATINSSVAVNTGDWLNVAVTRLQDTGECRIFINGELNSSGDCSANAGDLNSQPDLYIGFGQDGGKAWVGELGTILTYSTVINEDQILSNFNATKAYYGY